MKAFMGRRIRASLLLRPLAALDGVASPFAFASPSGLSDSAHGQGPMAGIMMGSEHRPCATWSSLLA
ncbi:hypothetical protein AV530_006346 [Patagioenas fasciata monilis]|uniref:Secreted protein n=1 Tax=Patagioenas fasciata monilis TaxID=372326 RepID=A0A1V4KI01_PATFA|nr:hypothetical protein AV530_006346 [Patagioenas fasciata monilis]